MKKSTFKFVAFIIISLLVFHIKLQTVHANTLGDYTYTVNNETATITGYNGAGGDITIPEKLDKYIVTTIYPCAFYGNPKLTTVTIGNNVINIGAKAFTGCTNLTCVFIGSKVTTIEYGAFAYSPNLSMAIFLGNAPVLKNDYPVYAFDGCSKDFKVYYLKDKKGFTNPWYGYKTALLNPYYLNQLKLK